MALFAVRLRYSPDDYWSLTIAERAAILRIFDRQDQGGS